MAPPCETLLGAIGGGILSTLLRFVIAWVAVSFGLWLPFVTKGGNGFGDALGTWPFLAGYGVLSWIGLAFPLGLLSIVVLGLLLLSAWGFIAQNQPITSFCMIRVLAPFLSSPVVLVDHGIRGIAAGVIGLLGFAGVVVLYHYVNRWE